MNRNLYLNGGNLIIKICIRQNLCISTPPEWFGYFDID